LEHLRVLAVQHERLALVILIACDRQSLFRPKSAAPSIYSCPTPTEPLERASATLDTANRRNPLALFQAEIRNHHRRSLSSPGFPPSRSAPRQSLMEPAQNVYCS